MLFDIIRNIFGVGDSACQYDAVNLAANGCCQLCDILSYIETHCFVNYCSVSIAIGDHLFNIAGISSAEVSDESALAVEKLHCLFVCVLAAVAEVYKTLCADSTASLRGEIAFVVIYAVNVDTVLIKANSASSAQVGNNECALLKLLAEFFFCALDSHGTCVECVAYGEMRKLRNSAYSADRDFFVGAYSIVNADRNAFILVKIEGYHASDNGRVLCHVFWSCKIVYHRLIDAYRSMRAGYYITASRNGCRKSIYRNAVLFE